MLKKTKLFAGRPTPFVMELPSYHFPSVRSWALHVWERVSAYIKKAFTIIFASTVVVWFLSNFGVFEGAFGFLPAMEGIPEEFTDYSVLAMLGGAIAFIFNPLGFDTWQATAMSITGLVAKENVVATASSPAPHRRRHRDRPEPLDCVCRHVPHGGCHCGLWRVQPALRPVLRGHWARSAPR